LREVVKEHAIRSDLEVLTLHLYSAFGYDHLAFMKECELIGRDLPGDILILACLLSK